MSQALILMYHRATAAGPDPWGLRVTPEHLSEHFEILRRQTRPLPLRQLTRALREGPIPPRAVVVTFDDGYADNLSNARPLLERWEIPATAFLVTGSLGGDQLFWWDELERILLGPGEVPPRLTLRLDGALQSWELGAAADYLAQTPLAHQGWRVGQEAPTARHSTYASLWQQLRPLPESQRRAVLGDLAAWAGAGPAGREDYRAVTPEEVLALARDGLVEIGAHSVTHPMLDALPLERQRSEIEQSRESLEQLLGQPVTSFAYPHGAHDSETPVLVRNAGYTCAATTLPGVVRSDTDPYRLPRMHVEDWNGEVFAERLAHWFGSDG